MFHIYPLFLLQKKAFAVVLHSPLVRELLSLDISKKSKSAWEIKKPAIKRNMSSNAPMANTKRGNCIWCESSPYYKKYLKFSKFSYFLGGARLVDFFTFSILSMRYTFVAFSFSPFSLESPDFYVGRTVNKLETLLKLPFF